MNCNKGSVSNFLFDVWLLTALKPHCSLFPFGSTSGQANKNPGCSLLWCQREFSNHASPWLCIGTLTLAPPFNHNKNPSQFPFLALSGIFKPALEAYPALPIKLCYVSKSLNILLVCKWHQSQHLNQILDGAHCVSSEWPQPVACVYRKNS